jgi:antitoxin HicB
MSLYPIELTKDDNGTLLITCPALPEVTTFADDPSEVDRRAKDAIEEAIAARIADGREVPAPTQVTTRAMRREEIYKTFVELEMQTFLKVSLYRELADAHITRAELSRKLDWKREQVDRLFRLNHATRLDQYDAAFKALNREVRITVAPTKSKVAEKSKGTRITKAKAKRLAKSKSAAA